MNESRPREELPVKRLVAPAAPKTWRSRMRHILAVEDLAGIVYTSGKVFDGLNTGRLDTESFLRSGDTSGITSKTDLLLLEDLRDVAQFVLNAGTAGAPIDATFVQAVNGHITRSGSLHPGEFRRADQQIGVDTRFGRHEPIAVGEAGLQQIISQATSGQTPEEGALNLFVEIAKAQPFGDGNKRTALFVANALLMREGTDTFLVIPVEDENPDIERQFNDLLARAYIHDEHDGVKALLRERGLVTMPSKRDARNRNASPWPESSSSGAPVSSSRERLAQLTAEINARALEIRANSDTPEPDELTL